MAEFRRRKRKICQMCAGKHVSYKDDTVKKYVSLDKGKILIGLFKKDKSTKKVQPKLFKRLI